MSDRSEPLWLIALANDVSEGKPVDWDRVPHDSIDPETEAILRGLKRLAGVVDAHRTITEEAPAATIGGDHPKVWRHLVLLDVAGAGAFGTVYQAWDAQLERQVALKLLGVARDRAPLLEAQHLARIRHPNVVTVYGAEQIDQQVGIWMEFIEGETLASWVSQRGPFSAREAAGVAIDLCRALSALHSAGLLHRDVKAQNVMREVGGRIVLMDFSGSGTLHAVDPSAELSGTPLYMAPELLSGRPASVATDTYSVGVLLFYLLSGRLPIEASTLDGVRRAHDAGRRMRLRDLRPELPDAIVQIVERAAHPDPAQRYATAGDLEHALAGVLGAPRGSEPVPGVLPGSRSAALRFWPAALAGIFLLGLGLAMSPLLRRPAPAAPPVAAHLTIGPPYNAAGWPRVSPDGRFVVFGTIVEGRSTFWIRPLDAVQGRALPNTNASETPFWSPDSRQLAFFAEGKLRTIDIESGRAELLGEVAHPHGGDWNQHGDLLFSSDTGLDRVSADGGRRSPATSLDPARKEYQHAWPEFLPDGRRFLFVVRSNDEQHSGIYLGSLDSAERTRIMPPYSRVAYSPTGHLLFVRRGTLMAQAFDERSARLSGEPFAIAGGIKYHGASDGAFDVSSTGVLIYRAAEGVPTSRLVLMDRRGREQQVVSRDGFFAHPRFAPDGNRIAVEKFEDGNSLSDIWLFDVARRSSFRLTSGQAPDVRPLWSPHGDRLIFSSKRGSYYDIYQRTTDGSGVESVFFESPHDKMLEDWSRDGGLIAVSVPRQGLFVFDVATRSYTQQRASASINEMQAEFSPDARFIAYVTSDSENCEVYIEPVPATGARWQVSSGGGAEPHWRADGRELVYLSVDGWLMSVAVAGGRDPKLAAPVRMFRVAVPEISGASDVGLSPDGQHLIVNSLVGDATVPPIHVLVNWTSFKPASGIR